MERIRLRIRLAERRFAKRCGSNANGASERCLDFAKKVADRLTKLDSRVQERIGKIQSTCGASSTGEKCKNAAERIARLQKIDTRIKAFEQKVQDWLAGKTVSTSPPSSDSSLDQAAAGLGQVSQQAGGNG